VEGQPVVEGTAPRPQAEEGRAGAGEVALGHHGEQVLGVDQVDARQRAGSAMPDPRRGPPPEVLLRDRFLAPGECVTIVDSLARTGIAAHVHEFYEIAFVLSGQGRHLYGSRVEDLAAGDVLLINPSMPHAFQVQNEAPLLVRNVLFTEAALAGLLDAPEVGDAPGLFFTLGPGGGGVPRLAVAAGAESTLALAEPLALAAVMAAEYSARRPGYQSILRGHLLALIVVLGRRHQQAHGAQFATGAWQRLLPVARQLYGTCGVGVHFHELAASAGWSTDHFSRLFKAATGQTVNAFMRRLRAHRAATRLLTTVEPLEAIATAAGYGDSRALGRAFAACFGMTPHAFRQSHTG